MKLVEVKKAAKPLCVDFELLSSAKDKQSLDLFLRMNVFAHSVESRFGSIQVAVKTLRLQLNLKNCRMPSGSRSLVPNLPAAIDKTRTMSTTSKSKTASSSESGITGSIDEKGPGIKANSKTKSGREQVSEAGVEDEFETSDCQVAAAGFEDAPSWQFTDKAGAGVLTGGFKRKRLGKLDIAAQPSSVEAEFKVESRDVLLTGKSGVFPAEMSNSVNRVWKIVLCRWLRARLKPNINQRSYEVQ